METEDMPLYIGTKIIKAKPMSAEQAEIELQRDICVDNAEKTEINLGDEDSYSEFETAVGVQRRSLKRRIHQWQGCHSEWPSR